MPIHIENRHIYLVTRSVTQTVNICTEENQRGWYENVFRLERGAFVEPVEVARHRSIPGLKDWLRARGAVDEGARPGASPSRPRRAEVPVVPAPVDGDPWLEEATRVVEVAIDSLVWEFVEHPYLHRVEHSLHARLFGILAAHPVFAHLLPIGTTGRYTQPVHKEWPETIAREHKGGRGNFDLAILNRDQLAGATLQQFRSGWIAAPIVIEMGLDYDLQHLRDDHDKLLNSRVAAGFLIHFTRLGERDPAAEAHVLNPSHPLKTAYAHCAPGGTRTFKTVEALELQCRR